MSVSSFEAPVASPRSLQAVTIETPASIASMPRIFTVIGIFTAGVMGLVALLAAHSIPPSVAGLGFILVFVFFIVGLMKFAVTKVVLSLSNDGIVETRANAVQARTILWSDIDEYLCERDPRGNISIRLRVKPEGKKLRFAPRSAFAKRVKPFEAFAAVLTARIDQINEVVDTRAMQSPAAPTSLLESAPVNSVSSTPPKIKKGVSFYDKPIAKVVAIIFAVIYLLGLLGTLLARNGEPFPYRMLYFGGLIALFVARVFGKGYKG